MNPHAKDSVLRCTDCAIPDFRNICIYELSFVRDGIYTSGMNFDISKQWERITVQCLIVIIIVEEWVNMEVE